MSISKSVQGNVLVIELSGELMGGKEADEFRKVIDAAIADEQTNVVVDMSHVSWMNSSGLGMLISALTSLRSSDGDLRLTNLSDRLKRPLEITKLDSVFKQFDSVNNAVQSFN